MSSEDGVVHIVSETRAASDMLANELCGLGFIAKGCQGNHHCIAAFNPTDILVRFGKQPIDCARIDGMPKYQDLRQRRSLSFPADMISVSESDVGQNELTLQKLSFMLSQIDPEMVYRATKRRVLRTDISVAMETGIISFFDELRSYPTELPVKEVDRQRHQMEQLLDMTPMSVWLDIFRNYHDGTARHCALVCGLMLAFTRSLGFSETDIGRLYDAAFFHDVGKAMIPLHILDKPGRLTPEEWETMKLHVSYGYEILSGHPKTAVEIARLARDHHEYLDGTGYMSGHKAQSIDDLTRILTICDIAAALIEKRSYKLPKTREETSRILGTMANGKLDPDLVREFSKIIVDQDSLKQTKAA